MSTMHNIYRHTPIFPQFMLAGYKHRKRTVGPEQPGLS